MIGLDKREYGCIDCSRCLLVLAGIGIVSSFQAIQQTKIEEAAQVETLQEPLKTGRPKRSEQQTREELSDS